ncbi:hypothetical protein GOP47_0001147 [Adiantum capillus-veneris]|uniref:Pentatricopeptide repeat-containing protein n=1 Tax=Adiantum capillus-veneris TaxID=13818 RepID=A0A9D4VGB6_ADICA|nr:hypothetical protein GOP47_0001147 [Adiantum capillus-veneris]
MPTSHANVRTTEIASCRRWHCLLYFYAGQDPVTRTEDCLIRTFASHGTLLEASLVFCSASRTSIYAWQAIISAHAAHGHHTGVLDLYQRMQEESGRLDKYVFPCIIKSCSTLGAIHQGKRVHDDILRYAVECDGMIGCALLDMYARCGRLEDARNLFDNLPSRDVVSWGAMIAGYAQHKQGLPALRLFEQMQEEGFEPTNITFLCVIKACGSIGAIMEGHLIHDHIVRIKFESDEPIANALIDMYAKCGSLDAAQNAFDRLSDLNIIAYSALLDAYVRHGHSFAALQFYEKMQHKRISPCIVTYLCVLRACSDLGTFEPGMVLHNNIIVSDVEMDVTVANTLIDMYAKCGCVEEARRVFDLLPRRSIVSWGAMIAGYVQGGCNHCTLELYKKMLEERVKPDNGMYMSVLKACGNIGCIKRGKAIHKQMMDSGVCLDAMLGSTLIDMYAKCGDLNEAKQVFSALSQQHVVLWSALITGHVQQDQHDQAMDLFMRMLQNGVKPDKVVFLCVIKACRSIGSLQKGKIIHHFARRHGFDSDLIIASALIDMYAKGGNMEEARTLFDGLPHRDAVVWSAIIGGYAHNGDDKQVKKCTKEMREQGLMQSPSHVLSACTLSGNIDEGQNLFKATVRGDLARPSVEHYKAAIDLFGRAGKLEDAEQMLQSMPIPADVVCWTSLLTACISHGNSTLGRECYEQISQLEPNESVAPSLISKLYSDAGTWEGYVPQVDTPP